MATSPPPYVDDPSCHETFAETVQTAVDQLAGIVRIEFGVNRFSQGPNATVNRISPVARIVLARGGLLALVGQLNDAVSQLGLSNTGQTPQAAPIRRN